MSGVTERARARGGRPARRLAAWFAGAGWLGRLWLLALAFTAVMVARSIAVGIPPRDPHGEILRSRLALSLGLLVVLAALQAAWAVRRTPGASAWWSALRQRWTAARTVQAVAALLAYHLVYFSYHNLKSWDVLNAPRDADLESWDRALFLGHSPAVLLHDALGQHLAAYVLLVVYEAFTTVLSVAVVGSLVATRRLGDGAVFLVAAVVVWILGVTSYYAVPSLGPFWSAPADFRGLPHTMVQDTQALYLAQRDHLLAHPGASDAFAQVSAFASLHVALTFLIFLAGCYYGLGRWRWVLLAYTLTTAVATVYLGWHFVLDDVAGVLIALVGLLLGRLIVRPRRV